MQLAGRELQFASGANLRGVPDAPRSKLTFDLERLRIRWEPAGSEAPRVYECADPTDSESAGIAKKPLPLLGVNARCTPRSFSLLLLLAIAKRESDDGWLVDHDDRVTGLPGWELPERQRADRSPDSERKWRANSIRALIRLRAKAGPHYVVERRTRPPNQKEKPASRLIDLELPGFDVEAARNWMSRKREQTPDPGGVATLHAGPSAAGREGRGAEIVARKKRGLPPSGPGTDLDAEDARLWIEGIAPGLHERTYLPYRNAPCASLYADDIATYLARRHKGEAFRFGSALVPVTVLWKNTEGLIAPDSVLGGFKSTKPSALMQSTLLTPSEYLQARELMKRTCGGPRSPVQYEGNDYRMISVDLPQKTGDLPRINGAFGLFYDNYLTQYAMEWELTKVLLRHTTANHARALAMPGALPLREAVESGGRNPLIDGSGRCAAITVSTLVVFERPRDGFWTMVKRRSAAVGVSSGLHHVVPAGMFEAANVGDRWSIEMNVWRELLEELFSLKDMTGTGRGGNLDFVLGKKPIHVLLKLLGRGDAELSVTGICCDLLNLRLEICTVLFVKGPAFAKARKMKLNWEYVDDGSNGSFGLAWDRVDDLISKRSAKRDIVPSGAVCLGLGREWVRNRHGM